MVILRNNNTPVPAERHLLLLFILLELYLGRFVHRTPGLEVVRTFPILASIVRARQTVARDRKDLASDPFDRYT